MMKTQLRIGKTKQRVEQTIEKISSEKRVGSKLSTYIIQSWHCIYHSIILRSWRFVFVEVAILLTQWIKFLFITLTPCLIISSNKLTIYFTFKIQEHFSFFQLWLRTKFKKLKWNDVNIARQGITQKMDA